MKKANISQQSLLVTLVTLMLVIVWGMAYYDVDRTRHTLLSEAQARTASNAQIFSEYSIATIKRIDELMISTRPRWSGDWKTFADNVQERQASVADIAFQVAIVDKDGIPVFSNLAKPSTRTDLSDREHFTVHKNAPGVDRLFISKPVKGRVSGKWSIQFTRPIFDKGRFNGVMVVSVSPELFAQFAEKLNIGKLSVMTLVRSTGEVMARYPIKDSNYGQLIKDSPYLFPDAPIVGNFSRVSSIDGAERIYGFKRLVDFGVTVLVGESMDDVLRPYVDHRRSVIWTCAGISVLLAFLYFLAFRSIVAFQLIQQNLLVAKEDALAASVSKSQFLANMSHEIRTPMNAILGMLTLLRKTELTTRQADYAAKSDGAARALLGLLNEILDFSKIEAGKMTLDPHPFAIDRVLRDLSVLLSSNVGEKPVEMLFDVDPQLPRQLVGDAMRLQQVLLNLGSNAIKFTARGEVVLSIQVLRRTDDAVTLQFSMRDSGIGIAPENQARIFSGFTQAESSTTRRFGGTGLGIVISQRFVSMMGGELELQSELGKGSRFYFTVTLPIAAAETRDEQDRMRARADSASWRTLVIDDNPSAREMLEHMGQSLGWQIDLAQSGAQALQMLEQRTAQGIHYQAIFVDWSMPDMDGWQTSQHIRDMQAEQAKAGDTSAAPVVVMVTAHGREMLSQRSTAEQALLDGFLVKPITASMLFDAVIDARASHDLPHPSRVSAQATQHRLEGMRLLLVEDNLNNQQVARELLEDEGAVVQIANHGQEAVEAIAAAAAANADTAVFDVVLMDLQMPVMDGFAATRAIRRDLGQATLPIVAMTANAMASDRDACLSAGMNDHVGKPFDLNDLVRVLRRQAQWGDALPTPAHTGLVLSDAVVQAASNAGVDITTALNRLGGKQDVFRRMLQTFVKELQRMPEQLQALAQTHALTHAKGATPDDAQRMLHSLKGLAATMGAGALATEAASAEKAMAGAPTPEQCLAATTQANNAIALALPGLQMLLAALEHDQVLTADSDAGAAALDRPALVAALGSMAALLQADNMEAMNAMAELQQQFGAVLGDELNALEAAMAEMAFDLALPHCQALLENYADSARV